MAAHDRIRLTGQLKRGLPATGALSSSLPRPRSPTGPERPGTPDCHAPNHARDPLPVRPRRRPPRDRPGPDPRRDRARARRPGPRRGGARAARAPRAGPGVRRPLQPAARVRRPARRRRRQGRRRLPRQLQARPAVRAGAAHALRPAHRRPARDPRRDRDHGVAHGRGDRARRPPPRAHGRAASSATSARAAPRSRT